MMESVIATEDSLCDPQGAVGRRDGQPWGSLPFSAVHIAETSAFWAASKLGRPSRWRELVAPAWDGVVRALEFVDLGRPGAFSYVRTASRRAALDAGARDFGSVVRRPRGQNRLDLAVLTDDEEKERDMRRSIGIIGNRYDLGHVPSPEDEAIEREDVEIVHEALAALSPREREVVEAVFFDDYDLSALARRMGVSRQRVHQLLVRAVLKMRRRIEDADDSLPQEASER